jgi:hypothetical protein
MKTLRISLFLVLALPAMLACGLTNTVSDAVTGGDQFNPAADLWSDVPRMDGLSPSEIDDLPLPVKLLMRTILGNLGRFNQEGEDQTTGNIDWIAFELNGTPDDIRNFYTPELMAANGWEVESGEACAGASASGLQGTGTFCSFTKKEGGMQKLVGIIATQEEAGKPTTVFYLRLEVKEGSTEQ